MKKNDDLLLSIIIPVYNEEKNIDVFYESLKKVLNKLKNIKHEIVYVDDGSHDNSVSRITNLSKLDASIKLIRLQRNFGKELATTAGLNRARGDAVMMVDADGQHPVELIPEFVEKWQNGSLHVVGVRISNSNEGIVKKYGSKMFYRLFNRTSGHNLIPGSTDFRLLDKSIVTKFNMLQERNRITRGLIDWLGVKSEIIEFKANPRIEGEAGYKVSKLIKLALTSFLSMSFKPLYLIGYMGAVITPLASLTAIFMIVEDIILDDPLGLDISGSGYLGVIIVFLVGIILISQGLVAVYISYIYEEVRDRPLYIVDEQSSIL